MLDHGLSAREVEIVQFAAEGTTDKEIAARLGLSLGTVSTYWARCRTKLGVRTRAACVAVLLGGARERQNADEPRYRARWNALMETTDDAVAVVSPNGRVAQASQAFLDCLGSSLPELRQHGNRLNDRLSSLAEHDGPDGEFGAAESMEREPHVLMHEDGTTEKVFVSSRPIQLGPTEMPEERLLRIERD